MIIPHPVIKSTELESPEKIKKNTDVLVPPSDLITMGNAPQRYL